MINYHREGLIRGIATLVAAALVIPYGGCKSTQRVTDVPIPPTPEPQDCENIGIGSTFFTTKETVAQPCPSDTPELRKKYCEGDTDLSSEPTTLASGTAIIISPNLDNQFRAVDVENKAWLRAISENKEKGGTRTSWILEDAICP